ncbi:hypothetical protein NYR95_14305 [Xanthomonas dyei]|uniref:Uncharacterized protein n=1 Tax=Xanthomonas dyei TaxID=743699 RepID=A0ABZ0DE97_9XANT|nr:hypothetical protein [Xanthomonas dyei]WOB28620.1 hypothetical protein NYR99_14300 [Xanthomonas dyei]WOB56242.1 hypothetical protein NYR95_14305 [Xanthomonas dyei]
MALNCGESTGLVVTALLAALIIGLATSMAQGASQLYWTLTDGVSHAITKTVTGDSDSPYEAIDKDLMLMQVAMSGLDQIKTGGDSAYSALGQLDRAGQSPAAGRPYEPGAPARNTENPNAQQSTSGRTAYSDAPADNNQTGKLGKAAT